MQHSTYKKTSRKPPKQIIMIGHCNLCSIDILNSVLQGGEWQTYSAWGGGSRFFQGIHIPQYV